jgi:glutamine synthetase
MANPYLAYGLVIYAVLSGLEEKLTPPAPQTRNLYLATAEELKDLERLPATRREAARAAAGSGFLAKHLPAQILKAYLDRAAKDPQ